MFFPVVLGLLMFWGLSKSFHLVEEVSVGEMIDKLEKYNNFGKEYDKVVEGLSGERVYNKEYGIQIEGYRDVRSELEGAEEEVKKFWERRGVKVNIDDSTYEDDGKYKLEFIKTAEYLGGELLLVEQMKEK